MKVATAATAVDVCLVTTFAVCIDHSFSSLFWCFASHHITL